MTKAAPDRSVAGTLPAPWARPGQDVVKALAGSPDGLTTDEAAEHLGVLCHERHDPQHLE